MTGDYHIKFYHVIPLIIIYVIIIHDGGYSGISMLQKKIIYMFMEHKYHSDQQVNSMKKSIFFPFN